MGESGGTAVVGADGSRGTVETDDTLEPETSGSHEECDPAAHAEAERHDIVDSAVAQALDGRHHVVLHLRAGERGVVAVPVHGQRGVACFGEPDAELVVERRAAADVGKDDDSDGTRIVTRARGGRGRDGGSGTHVVAHEI